MTYTDSLSALLPFATDVLKLTIWLVLLSAIFIPAERLWALHRQPVLRHAIGVDVAYYYLNSLLISLLLMVPFAVIAWTLHRVVPNPVQTFGAGLPFGWRFAAAIVVGEVGCYWAHRWLHEVPLLWRLHSIHHSAEQIDFLVNTRAHPLDLAFTRIAGFIPMFALGLVQPTQNPADPVSLGVMLIGKVWQFFIHANVRWRLGWLEYLVSTPAFHHWHHSRHDHVNHNYSTVLPWMDWIFGTYYLPRDRWPDTYGTDMPMPEDLAGQLLHPLHAAGETTATFDVKERPPAA